MPARIVAPRRFNALSIVVSLLIGLAAGAALMFALAPIERAAGDPTLAIEPPPPLAATQAPPSTDVTTPRATQATPSSPRPAESVTAIPATPAPAIAPAAVVTNEPPVLEAVLPEAGPPTLEPPPILEAVGSASVPETPPPPPPAPAVASASSIVAPLLEAVVADPVGPPPPPAAPVNVPPAPSTTGVLEAVLPEPVGAPTPAGAAIPALALAMPAAKTSGLVSITVTGGHGSTHRAGERVYVCYGSLFNQFVVISSLRGGARTPVRETVDSGRGACIVVTLAGPSGIDNFRIDAYNAERSTIVDHAQVSIIVVP